MIRNTLLLVLLLLSPGAPAFGNCEAGGYAIHTSAEYKPYEPYRIVLPWWKEQPEQLGFAPGYVADGPLGELLAEPRLHLEHENHGCTATGYAAVERYQAANDVQHRIETWGCRGFFDGLPSRGYAILDGTRRRLRFLDPLPVGAAELAPDDRSALEAEVRDRIPSLALYAETAGQNGERIEADDIVSTRLETTTVGLGERPFTVAVAVLTLRNLERLYADRGFGYAPGDGLAHRLAGRTVEYPVIFFRTPPGRLRHVGDGSRCATLPVHAAAAGADPLASLGAVERFRISGAFGSDAAGGPRVLEVNDRFAYLLEEDGSLFVVRVGVGC
jgi:hypothetical protein